MSKKKYNDPKVDENEIPVCEECGKSFHFLLSHVTRTHKIKSKDYKAKYGLHPKKPIMSDEFRQTKKDTTYFNYFSHVERLAEVRKGTQFKKGNKVQSIRWEREKESKEPTLSVDQMITKMTKSDTKNKDILNGKLITKKK